MHRQFRIDENYLNTALRFIRHCAICSTLFPASHGVCEQCWSEIDSLISNQQSFQRSGYPFPVYSLFQWTPESEKIVRPLIYALKGGRRTQLMRALVDRWIFEMSKSVDMKDLQLIPVPGKNNSGRDHASKLCAYLAERLMLTPSYFLKSPEDSASQRHRGLERRAQRKLSLADGVDITSIGRRLVLVDDVLTSGATALAAAAALSVPVQGEKSDCSFEVWVLAHRPHLATPKSL